MSEILHPAWEARQSNTDEAEELLNAMIDSGVPLKSPEILAAENRQLDALAAAIWAPGPNQGRVPGHEFVSAVEAETALRDRLRRTAEECDALISILTLNYMAFTPENVIDCLRHIVRVAKGATR